jgi:hypothetical protein
LSCAKSKQAEKNFIEKAVSWKNSNYQTQSEVERVREENKELKAALER